MNQQNNRHSAPPDNQGTTRSALRTNPAHQPKKHAPTYRARPSATTQPLGHSADILSQRASARYRTETRRRRIRLFFAGLLALLLVVGIGAYLMVSSFAGRVPGAISKVFQPPVQFRPGFSNGPDSTQGTPVPVIYPDWSKKEPVNILLIGLDFRPEEKDSRADTQIVVHIDPAAKTVTLLSIPRDLWVNIPGYGQDRINAAFQDGEDNSSVPGGGPGLAMATIEENFGIPIHYYVQVDFKGFEQIVDTMGGITIDVPKPLVDNEYPFQDYGYTRIYIPAGLQRMDGKTALEYARSRHADSDIGRNSRQQQVLLALKQQGVNLNLLPRLNDIADQLSNAVRTDLSLTQVGSLAQLAKDIQPDSIQTVLIDNNMVTETILSNGADVLMPNWDVIRPQVAQAFADPKLAKEAARLSVLNGTTTGGTGRSLRDLLVEKGFIVPDLNSAPNQGSYPRTTITDYTGGQKPRTIQALTQALGIDPSQVKQGNPADAPVSSTDGKPIDIVVVAGDDRLK